MASFFFFFCSEGAGSCARQRGLQLFRRDGFPIPELKSGSEASEDDQADNLSNVASYVIGLHGSGDKISRNLQDWEVANVALSCHVALYMLAKSYTKLRGDVVGLASERACRLSDKPS